MSLALHRLAIDLLKPNQLFMVEGLLQKRMDRDERLASIDMSLANFVKIDLRAWSCGNGVGILPVSTKYSREVDLKSQCPA